MAIFYKIKKVLALTLPYALFEAHYNKKWQKEAQGQIPNLAEKADFTKMRLIIGVNRSGTTWLGTVLSKTETPIRYLMEGLFSFAPKLNLSAIEDHTSIRYVQNIATGHRLLTAYRSFLGPSVAKFGLKPHLEREDPNWHCCLTKQVHSLLATEALIRQLNSPIILMVRNPLYVVDSLLHRDGIKSFSLRNEWHYIQEDGFLERFFPERTTQLKQHFKSLNGWFPNRKTVVLRKALSTAILNEMMRILAKKYQGILLVEYEKLCLEPTLGFKNCATHFGLKYQGEMEAFLEKTTKNEADSSTRLPVFRKLKEQLNRPFKFLKEDEILAINELFKVLKLR